MPHCRKKHQISEDVNLSAKETQHRSKNTELLSVLRLLLKSNVLLSVKGS